MRRVAQRFPTERLRGHRAQPHAPDPATPTGTACGRRRPHQGGLSTLGARRLRGAPEHGLPVLPGRSTPRGSAGRPGRPTPRGVAAPPGVPALRHLRRRAGPCFPASVPGRPGNAPGRSRSHGPSAPSPLGGRLPGPPMSPLRVVCPGEAVDAPARHHPPAGQAAASAPRQRCLPGGNPAGSVGAPASPPTGPQGAVRSAAPAPRRRGRPAPVRSAAPAAGRHGLQAVDRCSDGPKSEHCRGPKVERSGRRGAHRTPVRDGDQGWGAFDRCYRPTGAKKPRTSGCGATFTIIPAASYSPRGQPPKYHRRWQA